MSVKTMDAASLIGWVTANASSAKWFIILRATASAQLWHEAVLQPVRACSTPDIMQVTERGHPDSKAYLGPMSPTSMPGSGRCVCSERSCTIKPCGP